MGMVINMKQIIHDKTIRVCVCGKNAKTMQMTAKRRVLRWLGTGAAVSLLVGSLLYPEGIYDNSELKNLIYIGIVLYFAIGTAIRALINIQHGHRLVCSFRKAYLDTV